MSNAKIEAALERIVHESPYNGPIVAQAYKDLLAGVKLFGVPASHYHRFLELIEEESAEAGKVVLAKVAELSSPTLGRPCVKHKDPECDACWEPMHALDASCPCKPEIVGDVVKHR